MVMGRMTGMNSKENNSADSARNGDWQSKKNKKKLSRRAALSHFVSRRRQTLLCVVALSIHRRDNNGHSKGFAEAFSSHSLMGVYSVKQTCRPTPQSHCMFSDTRCSTLTFLSARCTTSTPTTVCSASSSFSTDPSDQENPTSATTTNTQKYNWTKPTLSIAIPALIGMLADPLLSLVDTAYVGRLGSLELAALGPCTSIFHLAFNAFRATTTATTSLVATSLQHNSEEAKEVTAITLQLGIVLGVLVLTILQLGGPAILATMGIQKASALYPTAWSYLSTRCWAAPAVLMVVVAEGAFRGYGDTKIPLFASAVASFINLVLDPLLMFPCKLGVTGAAAATAISQVGAALVYIYSLKRRRMLPTKNTTRRISFHAATATKPQTRVNSGKVIGTILRANLAMMAKQGSLLLGWAYATSRATRLGATHVAAHQVALSFWLIFALFMDGAAVAAQVLMSRAFAQSDLDQRRSLTKYMIQFATLQGLLCTSAIFAMSGVFPIIFTSDLTIRHHLKQLIPHLAWQQLLVSFTLVIESLAVGGNQFNLLAIGTSIAAVLSVQAIRQATSVESIWSEGIAILFIGRLVTALIGMIRVNQWDGGLFKFSRRRKTEEHKNSN